MFALMKITGLSTFLIKEISVFQLYILQLTKNLLSLMRVWQVPWQRLGSLGSCPEEAWWSVLFLSFLVLLESLMVLIPYFHIQCSKDLLLPHSAYKIMVEPTQKNYTDDH